MIGSLISICPAVQYDLLYTEAFEKEKNFALIDLASNYSAKMHLSSSLNEDFRWWQRILASSTLENRIRLGVFTLEIFSDASLNGWSLWLAAVPWFVVAQGQLPTY